jgi:hypothetical protein
VAVALTLKFASPKVFDVGVLAAKLIVWFCLAGAETLIGIETWLTKVPPPVLLLTMFAVTV